MNNNFYCNPTVNLPYPAIQPESRNCEYAREMLSNVGGSNSEMTAVSLYFYNSVILDPCYSSFAKCFHDISIVEMHHMDMFADLAYNMGEDPRLWSRRNHKMTYWTPAYNKYPREICDVIMNSIDGERAAIKKYRGQADFIKDANIVSILNRIILDEERHIKVFENMLDYLR